MRFTFHRTFRRKKIIDVCGERMIFEDKIVFRPTFWCLFRRAKHRPTLSQAAVENIVYKTLEMPSVGTIELRLGDSDILEWLEENLSSKAVIALMPRRWLEDAVIAARFRFASEVDAVAFKLRFG